MYLYLFAWFTSINAVAVIPVLLPLLIVGAAAAVHGFAAPPLKLDEILWRLGKNLLLLGGLFLAIFLLWIAVLLISPVASFLTLMIPSLVVAPLVCCWVFGLAWRLGYDLGLLSAHIYAARWQSGRKAQGG